MVIRRGRAEIVQRCVKHFEIVCCVGAHLIFGQRRATFIMQGTQRDILQAVAGRADLRINLQAALQLVLVIGTEGAFKGEFVVLHIARSASRMGCT